MGAQGMKDILDLFGDLPDYPGSRKPKNRKTKEQKPSGEAIHDPFVGVPFKLLTVKGELRQFYTVGAVAQVLNRKPQTIRKWERKGWIPAPTYRTTKASGSDVVNTKQKGYRLYSREQVEVLLKALEQTNLTGTRTPNWKTSNNWLEFINYIKTHWIR